MFLGLPDPDPSVRGMDPDLPDPYVFGPPGSGDQLVRRGMDPDPDPSTAKKKK
jgi:hypothetical protein